MGYGVKAFLFVLHGFGFLVSEIIVQYRGFVSGYCLLGLLGR